MKLCPFYEWIGIHPYFFHTHPQLSRLIKHFLPYPSAERKKRFLGKNGRTSISLHRWHKKSFKKCTFIIYMRWQVNDWNRCLRIMKNRKCHFPEKLSKLASQINGLGWPHFALICSEASPNDSGSSPLTRYRLSFCRTLLPNGIIVLLSELWGDGNQPT